MVSSRLVLRLFKPVASFCVAFACSGALSACFALHGFSFTTVPEPAVCGDGVLGFGEACDGELFAQGRSCVRLGFISGALACSSECELDTQACASAEAEARLVSFASFDAGTLRDDHDPARSYSSFSAGGQTPFPNASLAAATEPDAVPAARARFVSASAGPHELRVALDTSAVDVNAASLTYQAWLRIGGGDDEQAVRVAWEHAGVARVEAQRIAGGRYLLRAVLSEVYVLEAPVVMFPGAWTFVSLGIDRGDPAQLRAALRVVDTTGGLFIAGLELPREGNAPRAPYVSLLNAQAAAAETAWLGGLDDWALWQVMRTPAEVCADAGGSYDGPSGGCAFSP